MTWLVWLLAFLTLFSAATALWCTDICLKAVKHAVHHHDQCGEHTSKVLDAFAAQVMPLTLRVAAEQWDSAEEQLNLQIMAREKYVPNGPSVPAIWMRERADQIEAHLRGKS